MTKFFQGIFFSVVISLTSCQSLVESRDDAGFEKNAYVTLFDVRHLTRAIPPQSCRQCSRPFRNESIWSNCLSESTPDCACGLYTENELKDFILKELSSGRGAGFESVDIENATLIMHGDDWSVKIVTNILNHIAEPRLGLTVAGESPDQFVCWTGSTIQSLEPGSTIEFQTYAEYSQPRVGINAWVGFSNRQDSTATFGYPPEMETHSRPFVKAEIDYKEISESRERLRKDVLE